MLSGDIPRPSRRIDATVSRGCDLGLSRRLLPWPALLALIISGCSGPIEVRKEVPLTEDTAMPKGIVVMPIAVMTHKSDAIEVAVRSSELAGWLIDRTEVPVLGPLDFKTLKELDEVQVASTDTDLVTQGDGTGLDLRGWWSLHALLTENRAASQRHTVDTKTAKGTDGKTIAAVYGIESQLRLELVLRDAMRGRVLAAVVIVAADDPSDVPLEGEPRPLVPRMFEDALKRLFGDALERLQGSPIRAVRSAGLLVSAPALAAQEFPGRPSLASAYVDRNEADRDGALFTVWDRVHPNLNVNAALTATRAPGVLVTKARAPLQVHDVITEVNGQAVRDVYQLDRRMRVCGQGCTAKIARGRELIDMPLPWAALPRPEVD